MGKKCRALSVMKSAEEERLGTILGTIIEI